MRILRIFDVSPFVHAGKVNKRSFLLPDLRDEIDGYHESKIYTGGASLIWNILYYEYGKCDMVFCTDRHPTIKQEMLPEYKGNREHNVEVERQKEACEYILKDCGFTVLGEDGYEADDFIHSLVQEYRKTYDEIYIYCNDSDLYYLVSESVECLPSSSRAKTVTLQNYTYTVRNGMYTPYNALTFYKILYGDNSDSIPALDRDLSARLKAAYDNESYHGYMGNKQIMLEMFEMFGKEAYNQCSLVFPLDLRVPSEFAQGDKIAIAEWGSAMRNKKWQAAGEIPQRIKDCIEDMAVLGMATDS